MELKIRQYCVTYNNPKILNEWYLRSLYDALSKKELECLELYIINNHTNFRLDPPYENRKIKVFHNRLRPDFSTGHLSRSWNQALIHGFESLQKPAADIVILTQDDTKFEEGYLNKIVDIHKKDVTFYACGVGDQFHSYRVGAIRSVGLWDERFCNIGFQESDYFLRQVLWNTVASSINDSAKGHGRVHNPIPAKIIQTTKTGKERWERYHMDSSTYHRYSEAIWQWKYDYSAGDWDIDYILKNRDKIVKNVPSFVLYPYFEKDVYTLKEQGFLSPTIEFEKAELDVKTV